MVHGVEAHDARESLRVVTALTLSYNTGRLFFDGASSADGNHHIIETYFLLSHSPWRNNLYKYLLRYFS